MNKILSKLLFLQESETLDFKEVFSLKSESEKAEFAKDISAFANTKGGHIIYGVKDKTWEKIGIDPETFDEDKMQQVISSRVDPPAEFSAKTIYYEGVPFGLLTIPESPLKPHQIVQTGQIFIRRGATTDRAKTEEIELMLREREPLEGIDVEPENWWESLFISFGRKYTIWRYGRLDVSLKKERIALAIMGSVSLIPFFYLFYQISTIQLVPDVMWLTLSVILMVFGFFLLSILLFLEKVKCPKCKKLFGIRRVDSKKIKEKEVYRTDTEIEFDVVYRNTYRCEFCNYKKVKKESEKRIVALD